MTKNKKRKYYRKCGICGERQEQSEMIRTCNSPNGWICWECYNKQHPDNGWICWECYNKQHPEYDTEEW